jgi:hypothetical protein
MAANIPNLPCRWLRQAICREFGIANDTLKKRLTEAEESPDPDDQTYSTAQIVSALFSGDRALRRRKLKEEADKLELENQITRGDFLSRSELARALTALANGIKQVIENSGLSREDQKEIGENLSSFAVVLEDVARRQTRLRKKDRNGSEPPEAEEEKEESPYQI